MSLKEDLIAARALIDTPDKMDGTSAAAAVDEACGIEGERRRSAAMALAAVSRHEDFDSHADIMALFDRAIEAAP